MKKCIFSLGTFMFVLFLCNDSIAQTVEQFKQQFYAQIQSLKPTDVTRRNVSFVQVIKGEPKGGYYPFKVTVYVHDYSPG